MVVGSGRSTPWSEIEKNCRKFDNLPSMFATNLDCQLVQVLTFCSCSCSSFEQGIGFVSAHLPFCFDLTQESRQSSYVIVHDM